MTSMPAFPMARREPMDPPPEYAQLRQTAPLSQVRLWDGSTAWIATRSQDIRAILLDERFTADSTTPGFPMLSPARKSLLDAEAKRLTALDPPEHSRLRLVLAKELTVKRIEALRPFIRETTERLLTALIDRGPPADFVEDFALKLPSTVISHMLGVPYKDHDVFEECSRQRVALDVDPEAPVRAGRQMTEYFDRLLRAKAQSAPSDDILSRMAHDHVATAAITHEEAVGLANGVVMAGHETTANMIALGTLNLLRHPDQLRRLLDDPSLVKNAVEEMLRYNTVIHYSVGRAAREDVVIAGARIRKGEGVIALLPAANRDPAAFDEPERFDIGRGARNHLAFSYGVHQCVGQQLARAEMQEVFSLLFQRLPALRLAVPFETLEFKHRNMVFGVHAMPVAW